MKIKVCFAVAGNIKSTQNTNLGIKLYQDIRVAEVAKTLCERVTFFTLYVHCMFVCI